MYQSAKAAFIVGMALGDGNLSNPNGRAIRLRITCDTRYPNIITETIICLQHLFPDNKVSTIPRKDNCLDISLYSNKLTELLPWQAGKGSKYDQQARVPQWIQTNHQYIKACLRGLILSDSSIYFDRGYKMVNFSTNIKPFVADVIFLIKALHFKPTLSITKQPSGKPKYTVRLSREADEFLDVIQLKEKT